ncbi:hypothetical protein PIB30_053481 [Stylosanthes scabra]|uniref:Uncharacterized protein n=1 Tax=Stylosanthes scabra TaxID=79078 RepID=A0ABU6XJ30_9FABA|nr:hypothetical protein [Stylosanthes scabra]
MFRFEEAWLQNEGCHEIVRSAWLPGSHDIKMNLDNCSSVLKEWGISEFGSISKAIQDNQKKLESLQSLPQTEEVMVTTMATNNTLDELLKMEEAIQRKTRNAISHITDDTGVIYRDDDKIEQVVVDHFEYLFRGEGVQNIDAVTRWYVVE